MALICFDPKPERDRFEEERAITNFAISYPFIIIISLAITQNIILSFLMPLLIFFIKEILYLHIIKPTAINFYENITDYIANFKKTKTQK